MTSPLYRVPPLQYQTGPTTKILLNSANRIKRVPVMLQNVMLYVIRVRVLHYTKICSGGLSFKFYSNLSFCLIAFLNILIETIVIGNIYYYWGLKCLISYCCVA